MKMFHFMAAIVVSAIVASPIFAQVKDNGYFDLKFGATFEGSSDYNTNNNATWGSTFPYLLDFTAGYLFPKPKISLFTVQQFSFDSPDTNERLLNYSAFLGLGKTIKVYYSLWNIYGLIGYSRDNILFETANSTEINTGYCVYGIGTDMYLKFLPYADLVITYRFCITSAKEVTVNNNYIVCQYHAANYRNDFAVGLCFGKMCSKH